MAEPVIPLFRRLRQKDNEFEAILVYRARLCFKIKNKKQKGSRVRVGI
jgi:hypothetical protein